MADVCQHMAAFGHLALSDHQTPLVPDSWVILSFMALLSQREGQASCNGSVGVCD